MKDIQIDEDGELRCANCGARHFTEKRTTRAKLGGGAAAVLTVGVAGAAAPLLTKKKLQCQACGTYNKTGNAQPYKARDEKAAPPPRDPAREQMERNQAQRMARPAGAPSSGRPGQFLTVKKPPKL